MFETEIATFVLDEHNEDANAMKTKCPMNSFMYGIAVTELTLLGDLWLKLTLLGICDWNWPYWWVCDWNWPCWWSVTESVPAGGFMIESDTAGGSVTESYPHSEHRFPAPSSRLCQIWLRHWRGTLYLRAAVHRRGQHARKHEAHAPRVKKSSVSIQTILV